ncbi:unnamed protein product [Ilex paraguariensis]|uniref:F-ATPase gamma subunit n=1 Tax=Ilex paraguariensis TaxID=185542 RepID=A0ABC8RTJ6_9AQUA
MSRCFPYPPPGYSGNRSSNEALIESIKLQREREKAKAERKKEKRREKKEKKREKKEKEKHSTCKLAHDEKDHKGEKSSVDFKGEYKRKWSKDEAEQLERSGLTEEHGLSVCAYNPSASSESTQNSNKRRRNASLPDGCHRNGNIIRIRLPLQKHKEPAASATKEVLCSTSGRINLPTQQKCEIAPRASQEGSYSTSLWTDIDAQTLPLRLEKELSCSTSRRTEISTQDDSRSEYGSMSSGKNLRSVILQYQNLVENWVPPERPDFDDEELLFQRKHQDTRKEKRFKANSDLSCGSSLEVRGLMQPGNFCGHTTEGSCKKVNLGSTKPETSKLNSSNKQQAQRSQIEHLTMWVFSKPSLSVLLPNNNSPTSNPSRSSTVNPIHCGLHEFSECIDSIKNTHKITEAMKLVTHAKVRRAQEVVVNARPFSETLVEVLYNINAQLKIEDIDIPLTNVRPVKLALVVFTGDRGLCGGFNNAIIKKAEARIKELKGLGVDML